MVARAQKRKWIDLVAGLVVGAATPPLALLAGPDLGPASLLTPPPRGEQVVAQTGGSSRTRAALNAAIDAERRGDLDRAATLFREAQARAADLTPDERRELGQRLAANVLALQARREARDQIAQAESALQHGQTANAAALVKKITANELYLSPADRQRFQMLCRQTHVQPGVAPAGNGNAAATAHEKLRQARLDLSRGDLESAETLARQADQLNVSLTPQEDSPQKILADLDKAQRDPKTLLLASRAALQRGNLERAEQFARAAEQQATTFTFMLGDSPTKVLKEIQTARTQQPAAAPRTVRAGGVSTPPSGVPAPAPSGNTEKARALLREGRQALARGDAARARQCAEEATALKADLHWSDDNPARLMEEINRAAPAQKGIAAVASKTGATATAPASIKTKDEALTLLKQGREQLSHGQLDEANRTAARLRAARHIHWGLFFEDTPDKFQADVDHARLHRNKEQSSELLVEARRRFEQKDFEGAEKLAYEAQSKHGSYSIWDLGDRPNKLLADIQAARQKDRRVKLPEPPTTPREAADLSHGPLAANGNNAVAQNKPVNPKDAPHSWDRRGPDPSVTPTSYSATDASRVVEARRVLKDAREALNHGDPMHARLLADRVRDMHVILPGPNDDSPAKLYADIDRLTQRSPTASNPAGKPGAPVGSAAVVANKVKPEAPNALLNPGHEKQGRSGNADAGSQTRVRQLMAEAHTLQRQNRLVEARDKIVEAQRLGVSLRLDEETPNQFYQQISLQARQRIDGLIHHARDVLGYGNQAPASRCEEAERDLTQARQLAVAFGQDTHAIDVALRMAQQLRKTGATMLVDGQADTKNTPPPDNSNKGASPGGVAHASNGKGLQPTELLAKARLELRSGETSTARHLAEEAVKLGAGKAGLEVLRSIDAEEAGQNRLNANRTFDEVLQAYRNRDYRRAHLILASIDTKLLDERRQGRLREILNTAEMSPSNRSGPIALTSAQETKGGMGESDHPHSPASGGTGHARATDDQGQSMLARTRAMREVKFQQLRNEGIKVQTEALERFRTGQRDLALDMLQEYLARLADEELDPAQFALLRRPIESRRQNFELLKAQAEMVNSRLDARSREVKRDLARAKNAKDVKEKNVAQLMKQYNELFREAKYPEAEMVALRVKELDPDNPMATAAVSMARLQRNRAQYDGIRESNKDVVKDALNGAEVLGDSDAVRNDIAFTKDKKQQETIRGRKSLEGFPMPRKSSEERNIERKLTLPVSLSFTNTPLRQVIEDVRGDQGINIFVDEPALAEKGINLESPVTIHLDNIALKSGLKLLLDLVHLRYVITDDVLKITTEEQARGNLQQKVYQVTDLVIAVENFGQVGAPPDAQLGAVNVSQLTNQAAPMTNMTGMQGGQAVGNPANGSMAHAPGGGFAAESGGNNVQVTKQRAQTHEDMLIKLITGTIAPRSWAEQGGPGTIDFHPLTMALVINQTPDIQDQVQDLLNALRRLIDQEVAVEVKFISISEDFFERIGVNFNMNIVNKSREAQHLQPLLTSGQFAQPGYINQFQPGKFFSGLTPYNTLTNTLDIPINQSTYSQAVPPFGGYPGIPGYGGLTMGLAFLSDIQVFLFMEAVQGDVRSNVMQAPKLTLFNGQTANIAVQDFQFFTIGVNVTNGGFGQLIYNPVTTLFPLNIQLTIQAVISGDRRFVRLSLTPSMANVVNGEVLLFPVVTPIFPLFDGTATGQPVVFTQFVQQPRLSRVSVMTTVAVPDGGTVLMGGLKRLSEGRNEYGPPVLSKIPYLSRLFRNIGYGRSAESLLIMVTPRIIIQAEEEEKQTGYTVPAAVAP